MNREQFLNFQNPNGLLEKLAELKDKKDELDSKIENMQDVLEVLLALKRTSKDTKDPGKYGMAVYFVEEIIRDADQIPEEIKFSYSPKMIYDGLPVLGTYQQTLDSDTGDTWEAQAFVINDNQQIIEMGSVLESYRFLGKISD
ncbi:MAG: hypothetical protein AABW79_03475 [Nanoarchaeota archaeon]